MAEIRTVTTRRSKRLIHALGQQCRRGVIGENYIILNNWGYSCLLRGDTRRARRLLERAMLLAPGDPAIANNIAVMDAGLAYFHGSGP
jgi:hypothetical protein